MHLSDGVLSLPLIITTSVAAGGVLWYSVQHIREKEIPAISLLTAVFFILALINIPLGPSTVHPLLCGVIGILAGRRSALAIGIGLLFHALLFQHGGITTLGANLLILSLPAYLCHFIYQWMGARWKWNASFVAGCCGFAGILTAVGIGSLLLSLSSSFYSEGTFSTIRLLALSHLPLAIIEMLLTGFVIGQLAKFRPQLVAAG